MNYYTLAAAIMGIVLLTGCQSNKKSVMPPTAGQTIQEQKAGQEADNLKQCQKNLNALNTLKTDSYPVKKKEFNNLMAGASQYASIRTQVNEHTQDTVDALYRFQVSYQCAEINQALLAELAKHGGAIK